MVSIAVASNDGVKASMCRGGREVVVVEEV